MTPGHASMGKSWITLRARETVALGRELLGGNEILSDFLVAKAFGDLEPIYTFEGKYDINALVTDREVTGIASFRPAASTQRSRLECNFSESQLLPQVSFINNKVVRCQKG
ncbi:hypothetical protein FF1_009913 [Malus domestica]